MSMTQIEAAAREVAAHYDLSEAETAEIITRHLFPVVKPDDVVGSRLYYFKTATMDWFIDGGGWAKKLCNIVEIRGPIPDQPEVRS